MKIYKAFAKHLHFFNKHRTKQSKRTVKMKFEAFENSNCQIIQLPKMHNIYNIMKKYTIMILQKIINVNTLVEKTQKYLQKFLQNQI